MGGGFSSGRLVPSTAILLVLLVLSFLLTGTARAHRVSVFAWVEDDMVYTQGKFSGGRKARNATVQVYDSSGNKLLEGKTDANGEFAFKVPMKTEMKIVLLAGAGHRAEWIIPMEEFQGDSPIYPIVSKPKEAEEKKVEDAEQQIAHGVLSRADIESIVEKALDKKLKPVLKMLAESRSASPSVSDIFAGIGYILGLMGIGAYVHYRRKKSE
ncbi:MAG: hypothetical protein JRK26_00430 [Deltaproteobacteria bacterium]|nr:hypothetical protein [Deltaproteobacteria bacterium]MBW1962018.1 hypothetical protein [Deltaproteobacteria bacterium]